MILNKQISATKIVTFAMAHRLASHKGLCKNLHGHEYKLEVTLCRTQEKLNEENMVVDFSKIKECVENTIKKELDHATMLELVPENTDLINVLKSIGNKLVIVAGNPTAEFMTGYIRELLEQYFKKNDIRVYVSRIRLYETDTSYAEAVYEQCENWQDCEG